MYACEPWTLDKELEKGITTIEVTSALHKPHGECRNPQAGRITELAVQYTASDDQEEKADVVWTRSESKGKKPWYYPP